MEIQYFLEERTAFIRWYYSTAATAFLEIQKKIEARVAPYDDPPFSGDGESPFVEEWSDASDGLILLGRSAISMLKQAMQDYFNEWEQRLRVTRDKADQVAFEKGGMFNGYRRIFELLLDVKWRDSGADLALLEQVVLARNAEQHETRITSRHASHTKRDIERFGDRLRFVSDMERKYRERVKAGEEGFEEPMPFWLGHIEVTKEDLIEATTELEKLVAFLEPRLNVLYYGTETGFPAKSAPEKYPSEG